VTKVDEDWAWARASARDRRADGLFVVGVLTTGIYCRPSCAARHPKRENVRFFPSVWRRAATGLRACLRCKPDEVSREAAALEQVYRMLEAAEEPPSLAELAEAAGYSPHHLHRLFKRATGVTPAQYARGKRAEGMAQSLNSEGRVTDAIYEAGYSGPGPLLCRRQGAARHDARRRGATAGAARRSAGRRGDVARHDAGRGD
jgi:AraC family transcriptional regulator of adaptative response/methylated-DNA-[protein]-cysteine methyltransferase